MIRRRERRHLVSVARILKVEQLHFLGDLPRRQPRAPLVNELGEDAVRSTLLHLTQPPEFGQLVIRHPHVGLPDGARTKTIHVSNPTTTESGGKIGRTSSVCAYVSEKGSNSAVGTAVRKLAWS